MHWDEFQRSAERLAQGATEGNWRSAISRAYYAVFHYFRQWMLTHGLDIGRGGQVHNNLYVGLSNCGFAPVAVIGRRFEDLRKNRTDADYDLGTTVSQPDAISHVQEARSLLTDFAAALGTLSGPLVVAGVRQYLQRIGRLGRRP